MAAPYGGVIWYKGIFYVKTLTSYKNCRQLAK